MGVGAVSVTVVCRLAVCFDVPSYRSVMQEEEQFSRLNTSPIDCSHTDKDHMTARITSNNVIIMSLTVPA